LVLGLDIRHPDPVFNYLHLASRSCISQIASHHVIKVAWMEPSENFCMHNALDCS